jgi:NTE family protein
LALALGGGAARSLTHIGVLRVLEEGSVPIRSIAASSGGAIFGAAYAAGGPLDAIEAVALQADWRALTRFAFSRRGLLETGGLEKQIRSVVAAERFEDLKIPLRVVATDLNTGERVIISSGDLLSAVMASCAIPGVFLPVERDGRLLVDGGVTCNIPTDIARDMGPWLVMAVDANADIRGIGNSYNFLQVIVHSVYSMRRNLTEYYLSQADFVVTPPMKGIGWQDLDRSSEVIESGRREMERRLPDLKKLLRPRGLMSLWGPANTEGSSRQR